MSPRAAAAGPAGSASDPSERAEQVALFRYRVIAEAASARLSPAERGRLVRALAAQSHEHPDGIMGTFARGPLDRWIAAYQARGLQGLRPVRRADAGQVRHHPELLGEAAALRAERPARSAAHIADILRARHGITVSERTIRAHLRRRGLARAALAAEPARAFGRYEAERPNERWIGDVLVGPFVPCPRVTGAKRAKLFLLVDDHSRLLVHGVGWPRRTPAPVRTCSARRSAAAGCPRCSMSTTGRPTPTRRWNAAARCSASAWSTASRIVPKAEGNRNG